MLSSTLTFGRWFAPSPIKQTELDARIAPPPAQEYNGPVFIDDVHCAWRGDPILLHLWRKAQDRDTDSDS